MTWTRRCPLHPLQLWLWSWSGTARGQQRSGGRVGSLQVFIAFAGCGGDSVRVGRAEAVGRAATGSQRCRNVEESGDAREGANVDDGVPKLRKCLLKGVRRRRIGETRWVSGWERRQLRLCALNCASKLVHSSVDGRYMLIYAESLLSILWRDRIRSGRWGPRCLQTFLLSL